MSRQISFPFKIVNTCHTMVILVSLDWTMSEFLNNIKSISFNNFKRQLQNIQDVEIVEVGQLGYRHSEDGEPIKPSNTLTFSQIYSRQRLDLLAFYIRPVYSETQANIINSFSRPRETIYTLFYGENNIFSDNYDDNDNDNTICLICYELKKKYKMFNCEHSFCSSCCAKLIKINEENIREQNTNHKIVCPLCRANVKK